MYVFDTFDSKIVADDGIFRTRGQVYGKVGRTGSGEGVGTSTAITCVTFHLPSLSLVRKFQGLIYRVAPDFKCRVLSDSNLEIHE